MKKINNFVIEIATVNGSGSQSANNILLRSLFRMGLPVGGKNLFPSNIAGLPTWFTIRVNDQGYTARRELADIYVALNPQTIAEDYLKLAPGGIFIHSSENQAPNNRNDITTVSVPFRDLSQEATDSVKLRKLLLNMIYVGILSEWLQIDSSILEQTLKDQFQNKEKVLTSNLKALDIGRRYAKSEEHSQLLHNFPFQVQPIQQQASSHNEQVHSQKILIDGNMAASLGFIVGGCTFLSWYPITPSSSVSENFIRFAETMRRDASGKKNYAVIQAEDELAAISMVAGAGWAGARAITATSGPGLSLMAEAAGLFYYAEIPGVIWDVQRAGPSTGLPTRTAQGDILFAANLSHGDTKHVLLIPGHVEECFEFAQNSLDLAERLQTLVIVLSDLDLGMNFSIGSEFKYPKSEYDRGKVLSNEDLAQLEAKKQTFARYRDVDGDGIPYRTLPGTAADQAAFLTRGSGHNELAQYTENSEAYSKVLKRLDKKWETARDLVPQPLRSPPLTPIASDKSSKEKMKIGLIAFGSTDFAIEESRNLLLQQGYATDYLRLRAFPFSQAVRDFILLNNINIVVEQNRDAQMLKLLSAEFPDLAYRLRSSTHFSGLPVTALEITNSVTNVIKNSPLTAGDIKA